MRFEQNVHSECESKPRKLTNIQTEAEYYVGPEKILEEGVLSFTRRAQSVPVAVFSERNLMNDILLILNQLIK